MHIFNADGSEVMMCGNASRCIGKYVYDNKLTQKKAITQETLSGIKVLKTAYGERAGRRSNSGHGSSPACQLQTNKYPGRKMLAKTITVDGKEYKRTFVCM
mgnify:CR=1 FL=1